MSAKSKPETQWYQGANGVPWEVEVGTKMHQRLSGNPAYREVADPNAKPKSKAKEVPPQVPPIVGGANVADPNAKPKES